MARGKSLDEVIEDGEKIVRVWEANPTFTLGEITLAQLKTLLEALRAQRKQLEDLRAQVTVLVNDTQTKADSVLDITTRARGGIRAVFGPDSNQYELAGGTRSSERKTPKAKKGGTS
jgi:hypothetical protein